jgi:hypothetical protein
MCVETSAEAYEARATVPNLQDRFRQAALVWLRKGFEEFEKELVASRDASTRPQ